MAKDNREVSSDIRTEVNEQDRKARVLGTDDADEIAGMFSQERLDEFVKQGVLSGDWKSTQASSSTETGLPEDFPMRSTFEKLGLGSVETIQSKTKEELVALDGIGEATADKALAYKK